MEQNRKYLVIGAGFSGAVVARGLAERQGARVLVIDSRPHIGGNCHTERDSETGVMVHRYGPHIFNTDDLRVWNYVNKFGTFRPFVNRVKAVTGRGVFSLPINLMTINQFFGKTFTPNEARSYLATLGDTSITEPQNFEEQALKMLGQDLYENFFKGYTVKQWGCDPKELPASILTRLPVRFNYDDNYYNKFYQGIPEEGYSKVVENILNFPGIEVRLSTDFESVKQTLNLFDHIIYTGPIDRFFEYEYGRLAYRTVYFERIKTDMNDYQGNAVINYTNIEVPWTRIHEHKHFTPWESHERTVVFKEFSKETGLDDIPYYPKRLARDKSMLSRYLERASASEGVSFLGRLATYRYMDMEKVIGEALSYVDAVLEAAQNGKKVPVLLVSPL
ncbi:MAG: UDP-galactopyranose mutase [Blastochloris sp.]|nr:UDP-galactopyranose mutase [Blastochloris sp.]